LPFLLLLNPDGGSAERPLCVFIIPVANSLYYKELRDTTIQILRLRIGNIQVF